MGMRHVPRRVAMPNMASHLSHPCGGHFLYSVPMHIQLGPLKHRNHRVTYVFCTPCWRTAADSQGITSRSDEAARAASYFRGLPSSSVPMAQHFRIFVIKEIPPTSG